MQLHPSETHSLPHLVVVGGGFGGIELIKALRKAPFRITLIDRNNYHTFQPLLYQVASGGLGADAIGYPFRLIFRNQQNFRFLHADVRQIHHQNKVIVTSEGEITYDKLILATGSSTNYFGNSEIESRAMPLKSIPDALNLRSDLLEEMEQASRSADAEKRRSHLCFVVVGGGPTGVETAGALIEFRNHVLPHDYPELNKSEMRVLLIEASPRLLNGLSEKASGKALNYLEKMGVEVMLNTAVKAYSNSELLFSSGERLSTHTLIWAAGVKGELVRGLPEEVTRSNRYQVDAFHQVLGLNDVYAIGDAAGMYSLEKPKGHPMVAPVAVQQGRNLARNLMAEPKGKPAKAFIYRDKGSMATVGRNKAVVDLPGFSFGGFFAWLVWMFLHLMLLVGFRNRVVVFVDWMWSYFTYERALRLIVRRYNPSDDPAGVNLK